MAALERSIPIKVHGRSMIGGIDCMAERCFGARLIGAVWALIRLAKSLKIFFGPPWRMVGT
ncbi:MAG: hypothetical protein C0487_05215 [Leptothrix sp. (in: Bacteria)]|nr:hypothetical protein [Leptothrix sp. (in: b-proteobacteria)]